MTETQDFIVKTYRNPKTDKKRKVLRRYKGHDSVITIPDGVKKIAEYAFADDIEPNETITKIIIPDSVTEISPNAFSYCMALKEIEFPKKFRHFFIIFDHCPSVEEIIVPDSVKKVGNLKYTKTLKTIHVGENITHVALSIFTKGRGTIISTLPEPISKILLQNPVYAIKDGFVINQKHSTTLFRISFDKTEIRIPDGIETIGPNSFYELYLLTKKKQDIKPVEKVIIPATVKKIERGAFLNCISLKEVIYEGYSKELHVDSNAFVMCLAFHGDGREIMCVDSQKKKTRKITNLKVERLIIIHKTIKSGGYPNAEKLRQICKKVLGEEKLGISTIRIDLKDMRELFGAPLEYDTFERGYHYTEDFSLSLE